MSNDFSVSGTIWQYNERTGAFLGNFDITGFGAAFYPRGIVNGPDGNTYVSVIGNRAAGDGISGYVVRFNTTTHKFVDVFTSNQGAGCAANLHRPEGLVFGPDGKLYVTSFQADGNDTDKILIYNMKTRACSGQIVLDQVNQPRSFAQALLFGPGGDLFVPINNTGEVRRYSITKPGFPYATFVPANGQGGALVNPWYLTFGKTDASTLSYDN